MLSILPLNPTIKMLLIDGLYACDASTTTNDCFNDALMYSFFKLGKAFDYIVFFAWKPLEDYFNALGVCSLDELMSYSRAQ